MKNPVIVIVGPTASGKSAVAVELAIQINGEIISADSVQVYKYMNIGSGKVTEEEKKGIPHYMLDIVDPTDSYNVSMYKTQARQHISEIQSKGKIPIICGGTGLYIDSLLFPMGFTPGFDPEIREKWETYYKENGKDKLYHTLCSVDPEEAESIDSNNVKRVIRALEIYDLTGRPKSSQVDRGYANRTFFYENTYVFGLNWDREEIVDRIRKRTHLMICNGLKSETESLLNMGCNSQSQSMQALGYKEMVPYIESNSTSSLEIVENEIWIHTRQFAKRQMTWFKRNPQIKWIPGSTVESMTDMILRSIRTGESEFDF